MMNQLKKVNVIDINELVEKTDYNAKVNEIKSEISSIAGLVTTAVLNPTLAIQSKKTGHDAKVKDIQGKYFTKSDYNTFSSDILNVKDENNKLVNKSDISGLINDSDLN